MIRKTLTTLSLIGLLLSVGAWAVSYRPHPSSPKARGAVWGWRFGDHNRSAVRIRVHKGVLTTSYGFPLKPGAKPNKVRGRLGDFRFAGGFTPVALCSRSVSPPTWVLYQVAAPFRFLFLAFSWYPMFMTVNRVLVPHRRRKLGLCLKCGYDLRASKERCPECGTEFETT